ncbi:Aspartate-semialdehyde dehydrogenase [Buchnera aphidicola (Thelaxes suberi)]|uniref:aspartate-semialdehyde dehydrogenase n=1 Tax=Buchnera aphidicola TaxID=9 RepID=UPI003463BDB8
MKQSVGFIGWRGMVGSVLLNRMYEEKDLEKIKPVFFSTSQSGKKVSLLNVLENQVLQDAYSLDHLKEMNIIISCQGGSYTEKMYFDLRKSGWKGFWIDAASTLRMHTDSVIVLDPINKDYIIQSINCGIKTFVGGNCTVSLMLLALGGLFKENLIDSINVSTYQAASGAGSKYILEMLHQMKTVSDFIQKDLLNTSLSILDIEKKVTHITKSNTFPRENFKVPLIGSLIPWIDIPMEHGQTREEWKIGVETNKILNTSVFIPIDGICVRIGVLRCHSQSFTIKLKKNITIKNIEEILLNNNKWIQIIRNNEKNSKKYLSPVHVSGTLFIPTGRIRKLSISNKHISIFSVGDQLLWGAAEPLRRMLKLLI